MRLADLPPRPAASGHDRPGPPPGGDEWLARLRAPRGVWLPLVVDDEECSPARLAGVMRGEFEFAGETHGLGRRPDWLRNPSADIEWHILLHKFYYAAGLARAFRCSGDDRLAARFVELADSWMAQVPPGFIAADVTGRRVQNWICALRGLVFHDDDGPAPPSSIDGAFLGRLIASIEAQVEHLCAHLTPKRNHRTIELLAIFLAGVALPELPRAAHWREFALEQTAVNLRADLLADGVHCELSTDYHHLALRNWLLVRTLAVRNGIALPAGFDAALLRALEFSLHVHRPDGVVPSFSDGDPRDFTALLAQGAELFGRDDFRWAASRGAGGRAPQRTLAVFEDSGYVVLRSGWGHGPADYADAQHLVFDCGPLGEGNHGHFDCLSLELYAHGRPLLVDPGRCTYSEAGPVNWRLHFRGTAAHNTVCVDGRSQTRCLPRPVKEPSRHAQGAVRHKVAGPAPTATLLDCSRAPGFARLHGRAASHEYDAVHERVITWLGGALWIVSDRLRAATPHEYALHFQLAPAAQGQARLESGPVARQLDAPGLRLLQPLQPGQTAELQTGWVSARYGHRDPAPRLRTTAAGTDVDFDTVIVPWRDAPAQAELARLMLRTADGRDTPALEIHHRVATLPCVDLWLDGCGGAAAVALPGGLQFEGRWLHLRRDAQGQVLSATSHPGARLTRGARALVVTLASDARRS